MQSRSPGKPQSCLFSHSRMQLPSLTNAFISNSFSLVPVSVHNTNQELSQFQPRSVRRLIECRFIKSNVTVPSIYKFLRVFHINVIIEASVMTRFQYRFLILINLEFLITTVFTTGFPLNMPLLWSVRKLSHSSNRPLLIPKIWEHYAIQEQHKCLQLQ